MKKNVSHYQPKIASQRSPQGGYFWDDMWKDFFTPTWLPSRLFKEGGESTPSLAIDIQEEEESYIAKVDVAGVDPNEIQLQVDDACMLTISGERRGEEESKEKRLHYQERWVGRFQRTVRLPGKVDVASCQACYKDGVLTITLPKLSIETGNRIPVNFS